MVQDVEVVATLYLYFLLRRMNATVKSTISPTCRKKEMSSDIGMNAIPALKIVPNPCMIIQKAMTMFLMNVTKLNIIQILRYVT